MLEEETQSGLRASASTDPGERARLTWFEAVQEVKAAHLITGGAGFIGSHLADALVARGDEVVILDDLSTGRRENIVHLLESGKAVFVEGSVLDADLVDQWVERTDSCFHLASAVGVKLVVDNPLESLLRNVRGANVVAHAAARYGRRLLFTSTSEVYGKHSSRALCGGLRRLLGPSSKARWGYANTKAFGEMLAFGYARERGAQTVVVRLFNSVGPRQLGSYGMVLPRFVSPGARGRGPDRLRGRNPVALLHPRLRHGRGDRRLADSDGRWVASSTSAPPTEITIRELAERVIERTGSSPGSATFPTRRPTARASRSSAAAEPDTSAIEELCGLAAPADDRRRDRRPVAQIRGRATRRAPSKATAFTTGLEEAAELSIGR